MHVTRRIVQVALLAAALGLGPTQAEAQVRDPAKSMATGKRIRHADRKAAAQRAKAAREAAARKAGAPQPKGAKHAKPSLQTR